MALAPSRSGTAYRTRPSAGATVAPFTVQPARCGSCIVAANSIVGAGTTAPSAGASTTISGDVVSIVTASASLSLCVAPAPAVSSTVCAPSVSVNSAV